MINPKFALADTSSVSVIGSRGIEVKPQRTLRERLHFPSTPLPPSTNISDAPSNAKFGIKEEKYRHLSHANLMGHCFIGKC